jgi:hypothetical protein
MVLDQDSKEDGAIGECSLSQISIEQDADERCQYAKKWHMIGFFSFRFAVHHSALKLHQ